jgi:hypothetical protein
MANIIASSLVVHNTGARLHHFGGLLNAGARVTVNTEQVQSMRKGIEFHLSIDPAKLGSREKRELQFYAVTEQGQIEVKSVAEFRLLFPIPKPPSPSTKPAVKPEA